MCAIFLHVRHETYSSTMFRAENKSDFSNHMIQLLCLQQYYATILSSPTKKCWEIFRRFRYEEMGGGVGRSHFDTHRNKVYGYRDNELHLDRNQSHFSNGETFLLALHGMYAFGMVFFSFSVFQSSINWWDNWSITINSLISLIVGNQIIR